MAPYRPLLVLAGIWGVLLAISLVAYERLLYAEQDPTQKDTASTTEITVYPHQRLEGGNDAGGDNSQQSPLPTETADEPFTTSEPDAEDTAVAPETLNEAPQTSIIGISPLTLGALVVTCALGCSLLSRQLKAPPRPRRKPQKRLLTKPQPAAARTVRGRPIRDAAVPSGPKRLATYDPNQPLMSPLPQQVKPQPAPAPVNKQTPAVSPAVNSVDVTVVPDDAQHPLDWPEESLVNTADVRRRRSLSSFM